MPCKISSELSINGIGIFGSSSGSMMGTVGVEHNNYINPGWRWKTVAKGFRSATRRTRKSFARNWGMGFGLADRSTEKTDGALVSDTEKLGVTVLGRCFDDKVDHVPIKKRKVISSSLSPPPNIGVIELPVDFDHGSNQLSSLNSGSKRPCGALNGSTEKKKNFTVDQEILEGHERKFVYRDDFSGMEMLATVACNDNMDVGDDNGEDGSLVKGLTREQIEPTVSTVASEETIASSEIINTSPKDSVGKDIVEHLSFQDGFCVQKCHDACDVMSTNRPLPVQCHRLHWDLNIAMDDWEQPCDVISDDQQKNVSGIVSLDGDGGVQLEGDDRGREPEYTKVGLVDRVVSSDLHGDATPCSGLRGSDPEDQKIDVEGQESKFCFVFRGNTDQFAATLNGLECPTESLSSIKASAQTMNVENCLDIHVDNSNKGAYEGTLTVSPSHTTVKQMTGSFALDSEILCAHNVQLKPTDVVSCPVRYVDTACYEIDENILKEYGEKSGGGSGMHVDDTMDSQEMKTGSICVKTSVRAGGVGVCCGSPTCENFHALSASANSSAEINSSVNAESEELMQRSSGASAVVGECQIYGNGLSGGFCKVGKGVPSDDPYDSDFSQDTVNIAGKESSAALHTGYDSQFEDGELREEDLHYWEENEGEDGEVEHVEYGSEFEEDRSCCMEVESNQKKMEDETESSPASYEVIKHIEHCAIGDDSKVRSLSLDKRIADVSVGSQIKEHTDDCMDQHDVKDFCSRARDFRACKSELQLQNDGSLSYSTLHRKDPVVFPSRETCVDKFVGMDRHGQSPMRCNFLHSSGGCRESKNCQSLTYCGSYASRRPRPRSIIEGPGYRMISDNTNFEETVETGFENCARRLKWNPPNGMDQPLARRRPRAEREDASDVDTGMVHVRDTRPRSPLRRYTQGIRRGFQEIYRKSIPDNSTEYSNRMPHRSARRERSLSPLSGGRTYNFTFVKSQSRSSSRSPSPWFSLRGRNDGSRHRTRSPVLRSNAGVDRVRFPLQKRFAADYEGGFMSRPRGRVSTQRDSRWFDDRNDALDPHRSQKLPVREFRQSHRLDSVHVSRRLNSDEYFRPAMRLRGCEYKGSDDVRRERSNRYEMNRVRPYNADGNLRHRLQCRNVEDSFTVDSSSDYDCSNKVTKRGPMDVVRRSGQE